MATVTETYILEQKEGVTDYPSSANTRLQTALSSGAVVSFNKTPIVDPSEVVANKTRFNVVIVFRSAEDRNNYINASNADAELQTFITNSNTRRINLTVS
jgi:hypothetical protein